MGGDPNPKGGVVAKAVVKEVVDKEVVFTMEKQEDAQYFQGKIGQKVVLHVVDDKSPP